MDERENLPAVIAAQAVSVLSEQRGSLVGRGLAAIHGIQLSLPVEADVGKLFKQGMRYRYGEHGTQIDDEKARKYFTDASELNHAEAQFELAFLVGENGNQNESDQWLERSAHLGFGPALRSLVMYSDLPEDKHDDFFLKAREWYESRAIAGDAERQFEFSEMLLYGEARLTNSEEGYRWLKASAAQDCCRACRRLGHEYLRAKVAEQKTMEGIYWLSRAADLGDAVACVDLAEMYLRGHRGGVYSRESPPKLVEIDLQVAVYWYERGIQLGWGTAAYKLGSEYLYGKHLPQNLALAEKWLQHSANAGHSSSKLVLGEEYASGLRLRQDTEAAIYWLKLAAEHAKSTGLKLADIYLDRKIIPRNFKEAIKWLACAADGGFRNRAMKFVAEKLFDGTFDTIEEASAKVWLVQMATKAIETVADKKYLARDASDAYNLGELYELGLGVEVNMGQAIHWYRQSAEQDLFIAKKRLDELGIDWKNT